MAQTPPTIVALIPARSGSKRVADKNVRPLAGHPLLAYSIAAALQSGIFADVIVSTDSESYAGLARRYGAETPFLRPAELSGDTSPDIAWVTDTLARLQAAGRSYQAFSILRPTSPFRQAETIRRAWSQFLGEEGIDSLRAVEKVKQHPGKMWVVRGGRMLPLLPLSPADAPWHSQQVQALPEVYVQNASLEIAWTRVVFETGSIAGTVIAPFFTQDYEGFDVNQPYDWQLAEDLARSGQAGLPPITQPGENPAGR